MVENNFRERFERFGEDRKKLFREYGIGLFSEEQHHSDIGKKLAIAAAYLGIDREPRSLTSLAKQFNTTIPVIRLQVKKTLDGMTRLRTVDAKRLKGNKEGLKTQALNRKK